jgi:hypothetical protein
MVIPVFAVACLFNCVNLLTAFLLRTDRLPDDVGQTKQFPTVRNAPTQMVPKQSLMFPMENAQRHRSWWTVTEKSIALQGSPCAARIVRVTGFSGCGKTHVLYQGTTLEGAEKVSFAFKEQPGQFVHNSFLVLW